MLKEHAKKQKSTSAWVEEGCMQQLEEEDHGKRCFCNQGKQERFIQVIYTWENTLRGNKAGKGGIAQDMNLR